MDVNKERILNDPSASYWLKSQVRIIKERDPVDALSDALVLVKLLEQSVKEAGYER